MSTHPQVINGTTQDDSEEDGVMEALVKFLWREREQRLQSVYSVEDALISLGQPVTRTRQKRVHR
jgi:hypothetical protein